MRDESQRVVESARNKHFVLGAFANRRGSVNSMQVGADSGGGRAFSAMGSLSSEYSSMQFI